ncbi:MAG: metallophosphoesterase family protein, partial [Verrucomicrobia bacterium]|nr:metallophosphoesterase family protein [Verrucomicrobiota bacterium]
MYHRLLPLLGLLSVLVTHAERNPIRLTHGPMLGHVESNSVRVWIRTSDPGEFLVHYGTSSEQLDQTAPGGKTRLENDNTGHVVVGNLLADTEYHYQVSVNNRPHGWPGKFRTLPSAASTRNPEYNPEGLFNFKFQIGSCANQNPLHGMGHRAPTYENLNRDWVDKVHFHIMNGDWLYEELRTYQPEAWRLVQGAEDYPLSVKVMP